METFFQKTKPRVDRSSVVVQRDDTGVFAPQVGAGKHYLVSHSPYRNIGAVIPTLRIAGSKGLTDAIHTLFRAGAKGCVSDALVDSSLERAIHAGTGGGEYYPST